VRDVVSVKAIDTPARPRWLVAPAVATLLAMLAWFGLAAWRPDTTWHLAPALVAGVGAWIVREDSLAGIPARMRAVVAMAVAALVLAVGELTILGALGWLQGPVLFGNSVVLESVLVAMAGAAAPVLIPRSRV